MRHFLLACAFVFPIHAHAADAKASRGPHGGIAAGMALQASRGAQSGTANASGSNGGSYWSPNPDASLVDEYQPWPESEMRRFQKP